MTFTSEKVLARRRYLDSYEFDVLIRRYALSHVGHEWAMLFHQASLSEVSAAGVRSQLGRLRDEIFELTVLNREWTHLDFQPGAQFVEGVLDGI